MVEFLNTKKGGIKGIDFDCLLAYPIQLKRAEDAMQVEGHYATWHQHAAGEIDFST